MENSGVVLSLIGIAYAGSILGLILGPKYFFGARLVWKDSEPPWFLGKVVYFPLLAVGFLAVVHLAANGFGVRISQIISPLNVWETIAEKYDIVLLIISFAYLSISLDLSGFFEFCSFRIVLYAGGNGLWLMILLYLLCSLYTFFTSNDIVIISMTPIILYIGKHARIRNLVPLLISQFVAANTLSMGLYIGSPANIVLGDATGMTFVDFFLWMIIPAVVACLVTLVMIVIVFHWLPMRGNSMQSAYEIPDKAREVKSSPAMWVKTGIFAACIVFLTVNSYIGIELWHICIATAALMLAYDLVLICRSGSGYRQFVDTVAQRIPWAIAPFVLCFFAMVKALSRAGFTEFAARILVEFGQGSLIKLSMFCGFVSAFAVNVMNDIPSTVLWADMVPYLREMLTDQEYRVVINSLIVGLHPGCYITIIGALAGLMWITIIKKWLTGENLKTPTPFDLTFYGLIIVFPVVFFTCLSVVAVVSLAVR